MFNVIENVETIKKIEEIGFENYVKSSPSAYFAKMKQIVIIWQL